MKLIQLKVRLKQPYHMGIWTSYLDIYLFGKLIYSRFMNGHPELMGK